MNVQLLSWFDQGKIKEALLGEGAFFIPNHTYRDNHDSLLVMYELFEWTNSEKRINVVNDEFFKAIDAAVEREIKEGFRLILTYCVAKNSKKRVVLDESKLISRTVLMIREYAKEIVKDESVRSIVLSIEEFLPQIRAAVVQ